MKLHVYEIETTSPEEVEYVLNLVGHRELNGIGQALATAPATFTPQTGQPADSQSVPFALPVQPVPVTPQAPPMGQPIAPQTPNSATYPDGRPWQSHQCMVGAPGSLIPYSKGGQCPTDSLPGKDVCFRHQRSVDKAGDKREATFPFRPLNVVNTPVVFPDAPPSAPIPVAPPPTPGEQRIAALQAEIAAEQARLAIPQQQPVSVPPVAAPVAPIPVAQPPQPAKAKHVTLPPIEQLSNGQAQGLQSLLANLADDTKKAWLYAYLTGSTDHVTAAQAMAGIKDGNKEFGFLSKVLARINAK